jgi:hypothetical protein
VKSQSWAPLPAPVTARPAIPQPPRAAPSRAVARHGPMRGGRAGHAAERGRGGSGRRRKGRAASATRGWARGAGGGRGIPGARSWRQWRPAGAGGRRVTWKGLPVFSPHSYGYLGIRVCLVGDW